MLSHGFGGAQHRDQGIMLLVVTMASTTELPPRPAPGSGTPMSQAWHSSRVSAHWPNLNKECVVPIPSWNSARPPTLLPRLTRQTAATRCRLAGQCGRRHRRMGISQVRGIFTAPPASGTAASRRGTLGNKTAKTSAVAGGTPVQRQRSPSTAAAGQGEGAISTSYDAVVAPGRHSFGADSVTVYPQQPIM